MIYLTKLNQDAEAVCEKLSEPPDPAASAAVS